MASEAGRAAHEARVIEVLADSMPGDGAGQAMEAINQPPGDRVRPAQAAGAPAPTPPTDQGAGPPRLRQEVLNLALLASAALDWLWSALTQPQPAELAALPDPQARADRAALLSMTAVNVVVLLLIGLVLARPAAPRSAPSPAAPSVSANASKEAA